MPRFVPDVDLSPVSVFPVEMVKDSLRLPRTLMGLAERVLRAHGQDLRYLESKRAWLQWNGTHWAEIPDNLCPESVHDLITTLLPAEARLIADEEEQDEHFKFASRMANKTLGDVMRLVAEKAMMRVAPQDLNRNADRVNVRNGTVDLRTGVLLGRCKEDYFTHQIDIPYEPGATSALWQRCLESWCSGDLGKVEFLRRWCGYCLTGHTHFAKMLFIYGPGLNGKSTFTMMLQRILGRTMSSTFPSEVLMASRGGSLGDDAQKAYGGMFAKRLAIGSEVSEHAAFASERVKDLVSSDTLTGRYLYGNAFSFRPTHKIVCYGNHKPRAPEEASIDSGFWRRVLLCQFPDVVPASARDLRLEEHLWNDRAGILAWMVGGAIDMLKDGSLAVPDTMTADTEGYRAESDLVGAFLDECLSVDFTYKGDGRDQIRDRFVSWSAINGGEHLLKRNKIIQKLTERAICDTRGVVGKPELRKVVSGAGRKVVVHGIRILSPA